MFAVAAAVTAAVPDDADINDDDAGTCLQRR